MIRSDSMKQHYLRTVLMIGLILTVFISQSLFSQSRRNGGRAWPDTSETIIVEGTVLIDSTHRNIYFLDVDGDETADYSLHFGPEWYSPDSEAERPAAGDFITIMGGVNNESLIPAIIVFEIDGLLWREPVENWWQHQNWCDSLQVVTVEGVVLVDTTYFYNHYYLDTDSDGNPDYLLNFGPPWYAPETEVERPVEGEFVTIEGAIVERNEILSLTVFTINEDVWRDQYGPAPWNGGWLKKQHEGRQRLHCPLDSLSWVEVPPGSMYGRDFPDSLYLEFMEVWRDSIPNSPDSTRRGWYFHFTNPNGRRFFGNGHALKFGKRIQIQLGIGQCDSMSLNKTTRSMNNIHVMYWNADANQWNTIDDAVFNPVNQSMVFETESLETYYILVNSPESITRVGLVETEVPNAFSLEQNYPNPFNPTTTISYRLANQAEVKLTIYNSLGQLVRTLVDGVKNAGNHSVEWDGSDVLYNRVASGFYYYKLEVNSQTLTKRMVLLK